MSALGFAVHIIESCASVVSDMDMIVVAGTPVRLNGLDGTKASTRFSREARAFMTRLVCGKAVICQLNAITADVKQCFGKNTS